MKPILFTLILGLMAVTPAFAQEAKIEAGEPVIEKALPAGTDTLVSVPTDETLASVPVEAEATPVAPEKVPETTEEAAETLNFMLVAARNGQWPLFVGALLMLLVWLLEKVVQIKAKVGKAALPWVAAGIGIGVAIAVGLMQGLPLGQGITQGFLAGATAVGLWEMLFKHFATKEAETEPDPKA